MEEARKNERGLVAMRMHRAGFTFKDIGLALGVTPERARQIKTAALRRIMRLERARCRSCVPMRITARPEDIWSLAK